ncbi:MAG: DinB family protein [Acidobacteriota bacterium]
MGMRDALLPEFDHEIAVARKVLERVAQDKLAWKPHDRSMSLGRLATHVAEIPHWAQTILNEPEFNMTPSSYQPQEKSTLADILALFDENTGKARAILTGKSDAELMSSWSFKQDGKEVFAMPRAAAWRSWVMNHIIHHRGQLSVYLRLTGSKVPSLYGPSADES